MLCPCVAIVVRGIDVTSGLLHNIVPVTDLPSALSFATEHVSPETRAFMLLVATPPKATVFGTRFADFLKARLVMNIVAVVLGVLMPLPARK